MNVLKNWILLIVFFSSQGLFSMQCNKNAEKIPEEIWIQIFSFVASDNDITNLLLICKNFNKLIDDFTAQYCKKWNISFKTLSNDKKQVYRFLSLIDLEKRNKISSVLFLSLLKNNSLVTFTHVLSQVPIYDSLQPTIIFEKPYDKYIKFLLSKDENDQYQLEKQLLNHTKFQQACHVLIKLTPMDCKFVVPGKGIEFTNLDVLINVNESSTNNEYYPNLKKKDYKYQIINLLNQGKLFLLNNPEAYHFIKNHGNMEVFRSDQFNTNHDTYCNLDLKKSLEAYFFIDIKNIRIPAATDALYEISDVFCGSVTEVP